MGLMMNFILQNSAQTYCCIEFYAREKTPYAQRKSPFFSVDFTVIKEVNKDMTGLNILKRYFMAEKIPAGNFTSSLANVRESPKP